MLVFWISARNLFEVLAKRPRSLCFSKSSSTDFLKRPIARDRSSSKQAVCFHALTFYTEEKATVVTLAVTYYTQCFVCIKNYIIKKWVGLTRHVKIEH